ncbi:MAG: hypothetical protein ABIT10_01780 [Alteraurantiacibacter sp.]
MATAFQTTSPLTLSAQCDCAGEQVSLAVTALRTDGCEVEATGPWHGECDFLRLVIDRRITINGQVQWRRGNRAGIGFFGQIHPVVVRQLAG